jgi:hypothetical protein
LLDVSGVQSSLFTRVAPGLEELLPLNAACPL